MIDKNCFICNSEKAEKRQRTDGRFYKEYLCDNCTKDMIKVGYPIRLVNEFTENNWV